MNPGTASAEAISIAVTILVVLANIWRKKISQMRNKTAGRVF
jgi:hypothetical protein